MFRWEAIKAYLLKQVRRVAHSLGLGSCKRTRTSQNSFVQRARSNVLYAIVFMPAFFFVAMGLSVAFAPQLLVSAIAGFFVVFGVAAFGLAWKILQIKAKVEKVAQQFETRILVQAIPHGKVAEPEERALQQQVSLDKKIVYH